MPHPLPDSIVVSITACHAVDRGSIIKETDNNLMIILSLTRLPVRKIFLFRQPSYEDVILALNELSFVPLHLIMKGTSVL